MSSLLSSISGSPPAKACFACCKSRTWPKRYHQHVSTILQSKKPCPCSQSSCCWGFWCLDPHRQTSLSQRKKRTDLAGHALGSPAGRWELVSPWDSLCWIGVNYHLLHSDWCLHKSLAAKRSERCCQQDLTRLATLQAVQIKIQIQKQKQMKIQKQIQIQ